MKLLFVIPLASVVLCGTALGQNPPASGQEQPTQRERTRQTEEQQTPATRDTSKEESAAAAESGIAKSDRQFLMKAAAGSRAEIAAGKLAQQRASSTQVKELAAMLVKDHTALLEKIEEIASSEQVNIPEAPGKKHQSSMAKLQAMAGEGFEHEFLREQARNHTASIQKFEKASQKAKNEEVKQLAAETLPKLQQHLQMIQQAQSATGTRETTSSSNDRTQTASDRR